MVTNLGKFITTLSNIVYYTGKVNDKNLFIRKKFNKIRKSISPYSLMYEGNKDFKSIDEIFEDNSRFLNFYSVYGIDLALKKYGIKKILKKKGLDNIQYKIDKNDYTHTLSIYNEQKDMDHLIAQLILTTNTNICFNYKNCKSMTIEWLNLQDYRKVFTPKRMKLPGQRFPGLGMGLLAFELIIQIARRLEMRYLINTPAYFHNAYIYSNYFSFRRAEDKAKMDLLMLSFKGLSLASLSWLVYNETIYNLKQNEFLKWEPDIMIMPVYRYKYFNNYFETYEYKNKYLNFMKSNSFIIDEDKFNSLKSKFPKMVFDDIKKFLINRNN